MISPEILRRYPYFGTLSPAQLEAIADISEEVTYEMGATVFKESQPADKLYLLINGGIDLYAKSEEEFHPKSRKEFSVGEINPGELFGLSALVEPYVMTAGARVSQKCQVLEIDAVALRRLIGEDHELALHLITQTAKALKQRLEAVRIQLAAAWA